MTNLIEIKFILVFLYQFYQITGQSYQKFLVNYLNDNNYGNYAQQSLSPSGVEYRSIVKLLGLQVLNRRYLPHLDNRHDPNLTKYNCDNCGVYLNLTANFLTLKLHLASYDKDYSTRHQWCRHIFTLLSQSNMINLTISKGLFLIEFDLVKLNIQSPNTLWTRVFKLLFRYDRYDFNLLKYHGLDTPTDFSGIVIHEEGFWTLLQTEKNQPFYKKIYLIDLLILTSWELDDTLSNLTYLNQSTIKTIQQLLSNFKWMHSRDYLLTLNRILNKHITPSQNNLFYHLLQLDSYLYRKIFTYL